MNDTRGCLEHTWSEVRREPPGNARRWGDTAREASARGDVEKGGRVHAENWMVLGPGGG